jgi:hypothetical protein
MRIIDAGVTGLRTDRTPHLLMVLAEPMNSLMFRNVAAPFVAIAIIVVPRPCRLLVAHHWPLRFSYLVILLYPSNEATREEISRRPRRMSEIYASDIPSDCGIMLRAHCLNKSPQCLTHNLIGHLSAACSSLITRDPASASNRAPAAGRRSTW